MSADGVSSLRMSLRANEPATSWGKRGLTDAQPASSSSAAALEKTLERLFVEAVHQLAVHVDPGDSALGAAGGALLRLELGVGGGVLLDVFLDKLHSPRGQPARG